MHDVFVNYRTGDGENVAIVIERELSRRFGEDQIFRASKSIRPGQRYPQELLNAVRRCRVLLVVIGPGWLDAVGRDGTRALDNSSDWTRREIVEALKSGAQVIPVLVGRRAPRLEPGTLPSALVELAACQSVTFDSHTVDRDLARLGDAVAELLPDLPDPERGERSADRRRSTAAPTGAGMFGAVTHVGTVVTDSHAPFHTGSGQILGGSGRDW